MFNRHGYTGLQQMNIYATMDRWISILQKKRRLCNRRFNWMDSKSSLEWRL